MSLLRIGSALCLIAFSIIYSTDALPKAFKYEPEIVRLYGRVVEKTFYGPPGYGENPKADSKEKQYILILKTPIEVDSNVENQIEKNVHEVTIVALDFTKIPVKKYINKSVMVEGTLFHGFTGHHNTTILITVSKLIPQS